MTDLKKFIPFIGKQKDRRSSLNAGASHRTPLIRRTGSDNHAEEGNDFKTEFCNSVDRLLQRHIIDRETAGSLKNTMVQASDDDCQSVYIQDLANILKDIKGKTIDSSCDKENIRTGMKYFFKEKGIHSIKGPENSVNERLNDLLYTADYAGRTYKFLHSQCIRTVNQIINLEDTQTNKNLLSQNAINGLTNLLEKTSSFDFIAVGLNHFVDIISLSLKNKTKQPNIENIEDILKDPVTLDKVSETVERYS